MKSTTTTYTTTHKHSTPRLILKTTSSNVSASSSPTMGTTSITLTSSPITTTGSFYLPSSQISSQKQNKKGRLIQTHLRKPPALDTYIRTTEPVNVKVKVNNYYYDSPKRHGSLSSSCSSTSSEDNGRYPNFTNEELMYAKKSVDSRPPSRRGSSSVKFVRFAGEYNDGSSITDSSSGTNSADEWDPEEMEEEEEQFYFSPVPMFNTRVTTRGCCELIR
ncbi:5112_t:CDS:1 [Acaulospora colombiana]|uniref:5112_t:CDS:1 n=1 Tax=Acaulospora colombiana TaxID=27376 RepID=A0ACA9KH02_9GLOM|nr:5112_t:CDS:1 [Acaulospora colombiana]